MTASAQLSNRFSAHDSTCEQVDVRPLSEATRAKPLTAPPAPLLPVAPPAIQTYETPPAPQRRSEEGYAIQTAVGVRAPRPNRIVSVVVATVVALAVVGTLGWLERAPDNRVPGKTAVIQVGAGETVWDVARRVAPKADQRAVVARIQQLNGMASSAIQPGQELQVPDGR